MSLENKIMTSMKESMKSKDQTSLRALRAIKSAIILQKTEKGSSEEISNDDELKILQKLVKQRKDSADIYQDQGRIEDAIEAFTKALSIQHDLLDAWNNIYIPLQAIKTKISLEKALDLYGPKNSGSVATKIAYGILQYRLHCGRDSEGNYFNEALKSLSSAENIYIQNPAFSFRKEPRSVRG